MIFNYKRIKFIIFIEYSLKLIGFKVTFNLYLLRNNYNLIKEIKVNKF